MTATLEPTSAAPPSELMQALGPVRTALLHDATFEADRIMATATASAETLVATAEAEADADVDRAVDRAERSARAHAEQVLGRARTDSQRLALTTKRNLWHRLVDEVHRAAGDLRNDPRYPALLQRLEAMAHQQLGEGAIIEVVAPPASGIVARVGSRRVDYLSDALADRALDALCDEVAALWT